MRQIKDYGLILSGPVLGMIVWLLLKSANLPPEAGTFAGILTCTVVWWITEAMPLAVSALLASTLCVVFKIGPAKKIFAPYADPVIFLFIGSFWIARAMSEHGLDKRFALKLLSLPFVSASPRRLLLGFGFVAAGISLWVSNTATVAMLLPVALGLFAAIPEEWTTLSCRVYGGHQTRTVEQYESRTGGFESRMLLMLSFAASIGGLVTPVGTPPNMIGIGMLERLQGVRITFIQWSAMALPLAVLAWLFVAFLLSRNLTRPPGWEGIGVYLKKGTGQLTAWSTGEKSTLFSLIVAVCLWVFASKHLPEGASALLAAGLLFMLPAGKGLRALTWEQASRIDWSVILLFGGGMSLGQLLFDTKLAEYMGSGLSSFFGVSTAFGVSGISSALALWTSELASNTASANIAVPVALSMSQAIGVSSIYPAVSASVAASFGFLLPVSTPPNALVYGTGRVPLKDMIRFGIMLDLFGFFLAWLVLRVTIHSMGIF